jgi:hypothetical protein
VSQAFERAERATALPPALRAARNYLSSVPGAYAPGFMLSPATRAGLVIFLLLSIACTAAAQTKPLSERAAATAMTALWRDAARKESEKGNYLEASAACMFVCALAKGVRNGYLPRSYMHVAKKAYDGILKQFIRTDANGQLNLEGTVSVSGLGGNPYRDGSYEYYLSEKVVTNDPKGMGALILAATEMEIAAKRR